VLSPACKRQRHKQLRKRLLPNHRQSKARKLQRG
jgi:hypothetical protein